MIWCPSGSKSLWSLCPNLHADDSVNNDGHILVAFLPLHPLLQVHNGTISCAQSFQTIFLHLLEIWSEKSGYEKATVC